MKRFSFWEWCGILAGLLLAFLAFVSLCHAQTNAIGVFDGNGKLVATFGIGQQFVAALVTMAGFAWLAKFVLGFLPAAKDGTVMAWVVAFLKFVGGATKEKHQGDVSLTSQPTPNGLGAGAPIDKGGSAPSTPAAQQKTPNGL